MEVLGILLFAVELFIVCYAIGTAVQLSDWYKRREKYKDKVAWFERHK